MLTREVTGELLGELLLRAYLEGLRGGCTDPLDVVRQSPLPGLLLDSWHDGLRDRRIGPQRPAERPHDA